MSLFIFLSTFFVEILDDIKASDKIQLNMKLANMVKHDRGTDVLMYALIIDDSKNTENVSQFMITFVEG